MKIIFINLLVLITFSVTTIIAQIEKSTPINISQDSLSSIEIEERKNLENADEIFLKITYAGLVNTTVISYYYKNEFYYPFREVCNNLEIINEINDSSITGFLSNQSNTYSISFQPNKVQLWNISDSFEFASYLKTDFDYYFNAEFYKKLFGIEIKTDFGNLVASIKSIKPMPIFERAVREMSYDIFNNRVGKDEAKLLFPRERKLIGGVIFDYNVGYNISKTQNINAFYAFKLGGEVLGGDGEIRTNGNLDIKNENYNNLNYKWRYVFDKNDFITSVTLGDITTQGIYSASYKGISATNNQIEPRQKYSTQRVFQKTYANWSVEIYVSNQLIAVATADAVGDFYFDLPLSYGTTLLEMKFYGPGGEYYEETRLFQTPFMLLRSNEFVYYINYGSVDNTKNNIGSLTGAYGISEWVTTEFGYQYLENNINENVFFNSTTARLFGEYLFNVTVAPDAYLKASGNILYFSQTSFGIEYTKYHSAGFLNPTNLNDDFGANFFIPLRFPEGQINFKGALNYAKNDQLKLYDYSLGTSASLDGFNPSITYNFINSVTADSDIKKHYLDLGISYFMGSIFNLNKYLGGNLLTFRTFYDARENQVEFINLSFATTIKRVARLQISYSRNYLASDDIFQIQLVMYLDNVQINTSISNNTFSLGGLGSLMYDGVSGELVGFNRAQVGRSTAAFRFYIDSNGNDQYDDDEELIKGGNVIMGTSVIDREPNGIIRARELDPYNIYSVDVDESGIKNPLLVPGIKRFSFVADPNTVKSIEIPFYIAGEVDGKVVTQFGDNFNAVSGIKVYIKNLDDEKIEQVVTFSDGSYYYFGLRPGKYIAYIDEDQLKMLKRNYDIKPIEFTIRPIEDGDIVTNIDFILKN